MQRDLSISNKKNRHIEQDQIHQQNYSTFDPVRVSTSRSGFSIKGSLNRSIAATVRYDAKKKVFLVTPEHFRDGKEPTRKLTDEELSQVYAALSRAFSGTTGKERRVIAKAIKLLGKSIREGEPHPNSPKLTSKDLAKAKMAMELGQFEPRDGPTTSDGTPVRDWKSYPSADASNPMERDRQLTAHKIDGKLWVSESGHLPNHLMWYAIDS